MDKIAIALYAIILVLEGGRCFWPYIFRGSLAQLNLDLVILVVLILASIIFAIHLVKTNVKFNNKKP